MTFMTPGSQAIADAAQRHFTQGCRAEQGVEQGVEGENLELLELAVRTALSAAELITRIRGELGDLTAYTSTKSSEVDPVTVVDQQAEAHIVGSLSAARPRDGFVGEEGAQAASESGVTWYVDPIDGTVNFLYGIAQYAVSIAAAEGERLRVGVVVNVATGTLYAAVGGSGAIAVSARGVEVLVGPRPALLQQSLLATGFSYDAQRRAAQAELLKQLLPRVRDVRRMGSAALDLCALAAGQVDLYFEHGLHSWDFAAGALIATEAGVAIHRPKLDTQGADGAAIVGGLMENVRALERVIGGNLPLG
ncbi:inositol monophosphatase family protein [Corynebacterium kozikiae]|uniref:inositol monophosphatase family protein n=1 Tax=Corynebacterium kozikiae TaxID=2968469 RepID=UPI00211D142A|nr:inositol monophosphatase family protein [Corynebacterium sp. 76QC2CO]MCQ9342485.1 inositol monophosphatase [Corynebacterium sp. 76QC2CO]